MNDPSGLGQKAWFFDTGAEQWRTGLETSYEERPAPGQSAMRRRDATWVQDADGNPYISAVLSTLDPGTAYAVQSKTEQTLDTHGNVTQMKIYHYGDLVTPARTHSNTYLTNSNYTSRYIFNRVLVSTASGSGQQMTVVSNTYDQSECSNVPDLRNYDPTTSMYRGNVTTSVANGVTTRLSYDITGTVKSAWDYYGHTIDITPDSGKNYAVPAVITPNSNSNLAESFTWSQFLGLTSETGPNSSMGAIAYDLFARPSSSTSPHGAVTTYSYTNSPPTTTATTNGRWVRTTMDGLSRPVKIETGDGSGTKSIVEKEYDWCACSPTGKLKRVSRPYAPGGTERGRRAR